MGDADRLPMANVSRIVQGALPKDAAIAKEARAVLSAMTKTFDFFNIRIQTSSPIL